MAIYASRMLLLVRTRQQELKTSHRTKAPRLAPSLTGSPEDVLVETSTQVCVERSVLVLTAAQHRKEMEKPLPGSRPKLPCDDAAELNSILSGEV